MLEKLLKGSIELDEERLEKFRLYKEMLIEKNKLIDLTNVKPEDMDTLHFADSLLPLKNTDIFKSGLSLIDVGTGAGFPGLAIAAAREDIAVTLLDSLNKRCDFLSEVIERLKIKNCRVIHGRAEDIARSELRESFDIAVARALAPLNVLLEYLLPFVKAGGRAVCWKGPNAFEEVSNAQNAAALCSGKIEEIRQVDFENRSAYIVPVLKISEISDKYPRRAGIPSKRPL